MKYYFITLISAFISISIFSQTKIIGKVVDNDGEPLFGVNITTALYEGTVTDFDGKYLLIVKDGDVELSISSIAYKTQKYNFKIGKNEVKTMNFTLIEQNIEIEQTIVYGSKRGKSVQEEIQSVEILKPEILENNNVTDGLQAVELISGVTVLDGQMSIRGGSGYAYGVGSRVIAVQDGVPVLSPERNEINWDFISTENIEQMELIKGGGAVQYGSSALNGVLSTSSKWAKKKSETKISLYNTFIGQTRMQEAVWWRNKTSYFQIPHTSGLTFVHRRKMKKNVNIAFSGMLHSFQSHLKNDFNERARFNFNIKHSPEKIEGLTLGLYAMTLYKNDGFFFIWQGYDEGRYLPLADYGKRFSYNMLHPFVNYYDNKGNSFKYNGSIYYDAKITDKNIKSLRVYNDFQYQRKFDINLKTNIGITLENYFVKAPALRNNFFKDEYGWFKGAKYAVYLLGDYKLKRFNFSGGIRYGIIQLEKTILSSKPTFNFGVNYKASKTDFLRFSFAQSFRLPSIAERYVDENLGPINIFPNTEIKPETGYTSEIGYRKELHNKKWKGHADVAIFWTEFDNMIEFHFGNFAEQEDSLKLGFRAENIARARIFGWEFNLEEKGKIGNVELSTRLGYTYAYGVDLNANKEAKNVFKTVGNAFKAIYISDKKHEQFERNPNAHRPGNPLYGILKYRNRHNIKLDIEAKYKRFSIGTNMIYLSYLDNYDEIFKVMIPGINQYMQEQHYKGEFVLNLRVAYTIKDKAHFSFIVKNVLNNDYALRPSKQNAPINYTVKTSFSF